MARNGNETAEVTIKPAKRPPRLFDRVAAILEEARVAVVRTVNTRMVIAYWLIGREIVQEEQGGKKRAGYGDALLEDLSRRLTERYGKGYSVSSLKDFRQFHLCFSDRLPQIHHTTCGELVEYKVHPVTSSDADACRKSHTLCGESRDGKDVAPAQEKARLLAIRQAVPDESSSGALTGFAPELSWSRYRTALPSEEDLLRLLRRDWDMVVREQQATYGRER